MVALLPTRGSWTTGGLLAATLLLGVVAVPGCSGCGGGPSVEDPATAVEPATEPFEFGELKAMPDIEQPISQAKPGHWVAAHQRMTANESNLQGHLETQVLDVGGKPIPTEMTTHRLVTERPVALTRGVSKDVEILFYVPRRLRADNTQAVTLEHRLFDRNNRQAEAQSGGISLMPDYRFFFVALTSSPPRYAFMADVPTMIVENIGIPTELYRFVAPKTTDFVPLPSDVFGWTSIAYILWDDLDPASLAPDQQQAMLDWLHFGGQLIVSGPDAADLLRGSFLDPYLPVTTSGARTWDNADLESIRSHWHVPPAKGQRFRPWELATGEALAGVQWQLRPGATYLAGADLLVAEIAVGRGRIVMTSFSLAASSFRNWSSYDSFLHCGLMRRPARRWRATSLTDKLPFNYVESPGYEQDARFGSALRFFTRDWKGDAGILSSEGEPDDEQDATDPGSDADESDSASGEAASDTASDNASPRTSRSDAGDVRPDPLPRGTSQAQGDAWRIGPYRKSTQSGVAGWNDRSDVANEARRTLNATTGISPPSARFVLTALIGYLVVLIPLNWLVFRMIGRVEWAWVAAPLLAVVATIVIVRMARLDIGLARSHTELTIVELQPGYDRAHVTRFSTLYSSLSTRFDVEFDNDVARGQPWGTPDQDVKAVQSGSLETVQLSRSGGLKLTNFLVTSNSAQMLHTEEVVGVGGGIRWDGNVIVNDTSLDLKSVGILQVDGTGRQRFAWIGGLDSKARRPFEFQGDDPGIIALKAWMQDPVTASRRAIIDDMITDYDVDRDEHLTLAELRKSPAFETSWEQEFRQADSHGTRSRRGRRGPDGALSRWELGKWLARVQADELYLGGLVEIARNTLADEYVGTMAIGWIEEPPDSQHLGPRPSQTKRRGFLVAHLSPPVWPASGPDPNSAPASTDLLEPEPYEENEASEPVGN